MMMTNVVAVVVEPYYRFVAPIEFALMSVAMLSLSLLVETDSADKIFAHLAGSMIANFSFVQHYY